MFILAIKLLIFAFRGKVPHKLDLSLVYCMNFVLVGVLCVDEIYDLEEYPKEDSKVRASSKIVAKGGNSGNIAVVLSRLTVAEDTNNCVYICAAIGEDTEGKFLMEECKRSNVSTKLLIVRETTPKSVVLRTKATRTIVHYRNSDEVSFNEFQRVMSQIYHESVEYNDFWIHFEGRNTKETHKMMSKFSNKNNIQLSLELERSRTGDEHMLLEYSPKLVVFSQQYMKQQGYEDVASFFQNFLLSNGFGPKFNKISLWVCTFGENGSIGGLVNENSILEQFNVPAESVEYVIDTLGAGDTFLAGLIFALSKKALAGRAAVEFASKLAAEKIQRFGFMV